MFEARFGPRRRGFWSSVSPGMSASPFFTSTMFRVAKSMPTMQPRMDFRFRSPFLFSEYMMWNGVGRFVIEFWRVNDPIVWFMTEPQVIAVALLLSGGLLWVHYRRNPYRPEPAGATEEAA